MRLPALKYIVAFLLNCFFGGLFAQNQVIEQANKLIALQRYASAYEVLRGSDPNDQSPEIAIARTNLLLKYYIKTDKFHSFGLKDIAPNQNLQDFRNSNTSVRMFSYKPDSILNKLIRQNPTHYKLHYALGNFYYEVHLIYPDDKWTEPDSILVENIKSHYLTAYKNNEYDYWSLFGIGYTYMLEDDYDNGILYLEKSIQENPDYPLSYYNLAFAYLSKDQYDQAIKLGERAYELQQIPEFKAETAVLIGEAYRELKNPLKAYEYMLTAHKLYPTNYNALIPLLELELQLDKPEYLKRTETIFRLGPSNPIIYQDIMKAYSQNEKDNEFAGFLETKRNEYRNNLPVSANIHLYLAITQYEMDEWVASKLNFEKARSLFRNFYKTDHNVFKVIDSYTEAIKKKKK
ncbi:MAG: tetratricopeptide repeat protein [Paludibacteraceae bacterium]